MVHTSKISQVIKNINMVTIGAMYCVYENSGYLQESIRRIYDSVDKVLILLNYKPWNGEGEDSVVADTYKQVSEIFDPQSKIVLISQFWNAEDTQRNFGKKILHEMGIKWCLTVDDDELYNYDQLEAVKKILETTDKYVLLIPQKVYWKTPEYCIENNVIAFPALCLADPMKTYFRHARNTIVNGGNWETLPPEIVICHHYSYVRTEEQLQRKIKTFSHATDYSFEDWYENVWCKWTPEMENLHPNPGGKSTFKKAVPVAQTGSVLEPSGCYPGSFLEKALRATDFQKVSNFDFSELKNPQKYEFLSKLLSIGLLGSNKNMTEENSFLVRSVAKKFGWEVSTIDYSDFIYLNNQCTKETASEIVQKVHDFPKKRLIFLDGSIPTDPDFFGLLSKNRPFVKLRSLGVNIVSVE
jgi:hypothetical protein